MKLAGAEMPVGAVVTLRYGLAALLFLPLILRKGRPRYSGRDWALIALLGALNFGVAPTLQVSAAQNTQSLDMAILVAVEPLLTMLFAALFLGEKLSSRTWAAGAMSLTGALVLSGVGWNIEGLAGERLFGNGLFLTSMLLEISSSHLEGRNKLRERSNPTVSMKWDLSSFCSSWRKRDGMKIRLFGSITWSYSPYSAPIFLCSTVNPFNPLLKHFTPLSTTGTKV